MLRGGFFYDQYNVASRDFAETIESFNRTVFERNRDFLKALPEEIAYSDLLEKIEAVGDPQLARLSSEYLPITFGRRHGDPSQPWNQFAINLRDRHGNPLLSYEGNWRDIFQNWEALAFSYPEFIESIIAKFVNASTMDGYNPYRITKEGIDWEVEEPDNPWSYIGYWGDHQIIYLQKLLELSAQFHPARLSELLHQSIFCYANVPYRIREFDALIADSKNTVYYADDLAEKIENRVATVGSDGKLVLDRDGAVYQVNLVEKLLVTLLAKLGNLVVDGGIWLNTQRPEWNDANNALVGQGLSMVTLYYMRRFITFLRELLAKETGNIEISGEVNQWLTETATALAELRPLLGAKSLTAKQRYASLVQLGEAASRFRETVYQQETFSAKSKTSFEQIDSLLADALAAIDHSIAQNVRDDGMYHAYNTMDLKDSALEIESLYSMLEGQVAALSAGAITPEDAVSVLESLFASDVYRADQHSFMLYPDRKLPRFLEKNRILVADIADIPLITKMLDAGDERVVVRDAEGQHRFSAEFENVSDLNAQLDELVESYGDIVATARQPLCELFEDIFDHQAFTGRSGTMFGFEGLGCIYWHIWERAGFADLNEEATMAYCAKVFAAELGGHKLISNKSVWRNFPRIRNRRWSVGNTVLLGDALRTAHFSIGSGTRLAMEDSIALSDALAECAYNVPEALQLYESRRRPIVEKLVEAANESAAWYERFAEHMALEPWEFAISYARRSGRIGDERLAQLAPRFMAGYQARKAASA